MKIDSFDIHAGVIWANETTNPRSIQQKTTSMLGTLNIIQVPILKKQFIFEARDGGKRARGYFTREVVNYLLEAEANFSQLNVEYRGINYTVIVSPGGVQLIPKKEIETITNSDPYTGTLSFQEI